MDAGTRILRLGCGVTLAVTVPIVGLILFGLLGFIAGLVIGVLFGGWMIAGAFQNRPPSDPT